MSNPALTTDQNLLPVQAYFNVDGSFNTFIGQGQPFYATANPIQSGVTLTNSTIDSTTIGATTPSTGAFTNISTTTGSITTTPSAATDIANKQYVDYALLGLSWKEPAKAATTANITLSGAQTIDTVSVVAGDIVLVKNQTNAAQNGIYTVQTGAWTYAPGSTTWAQYIGAIIYIVSGGQATSAFYTTAQPGGTLGTTAMNWYNLSFSSSYTAGTGLTLTGTQFSITNTAVSAGSYGSASSVPTYTVNAQGQLTAASNTTIAIANTQVSGLGTLSTQNASSVAITGGTINGTSIGASSTSTGAFTTLSGTTITASTQFSGPGTGLTGTATSLNIGGNAATATSATSATSATTATNLAGGANGSIPYQTGSGATTFLGIGSTGQFLTISGGVPTWGSISSSTVSSFSAGTTGFTPSSATTGAITLSGTLNVANGGTGVTSSSGVNSVVLRDANGNVTTNCLFEGYANQAASGTTITLTASTAQNYAISGSGGQTIQLPNATTLPNGALFTFNNNQSSGTIVIQNNSATTIATVQSGSYITVVLLSNSSAAGTWDYHNSPPSNASWSTNTLSWAGSYTNGTWNGNVIGLAYGGTNANLTAVAGGAVYSSGSALGITAAGTSGQVLTSNGASAPTWQNNSATVSITDDTSTNATRYPLFSSITTGSINTEYTSSTKFQFNPSTGTLTTTNLSTGALTATGTTTLATSLTGLAKLTSGVVSSATAGTDYVAPGTATTFTATQTFNGSSSVLAAVFANAAETTTISATAATGTINYDVTTQSVIYYTSNASANWTVNFRASSGTSLNTAMSTGQSVTVVFLVTQGSTAYYNNAITIDGTSFTPKYQGGTAWSSGNASGVDAYSYTIVKTGSAAFTVFAAQTQFK
jgi:hypothetical protein